MKNTTYCLCFFESSCFPNFSVRLPLPYPVFSKASSDSLAAAAFTAHTRRTHKHREYVVPARERDEKSLAFARRQSALCTHARVYRMRVRHCQCHRCAEKSRRNERSK